MVPVTPEALMKKSLNLPLIFAILVPAVSVAQSAPAQPRTSGSPAWQPALKPRSMAGLVSCDSKTFTDAKQNQWTVAKPSAFAGFENRRVNLKYLPVSGHQIEVVSAKPAAPRPQVTAFKTDSAFRR